MGPGVISSIVSRLGNTLVVVGLLKVKKKSVYVKKVQQNCCMARIPSECGADPLVYKRLHGFSCIKSSETPSSK